MEAEAGAAVIAPGGKERVEGLALHIRRHSGAIVGKNDLDIVVAAWPGRNRDGSGTAIGKGMIGGVQEQIGQDLLVGTVIAVDHEALWHIERERDRRALEDRAQASDDLLSRLAKAERPSLGVRAVDRDLFERLDQLAGAVQVCYQLLGR